MAQKKLVICDTNVLIEYFKNNKEIIHAIEKFGFNNAAISCVTVGEMYFGALNKTELNKIKRVTNKFIHMDINTQISRTFTKLMFQYSLSHNLTIPDALIAATALTNKIELYTHNQKDFKFIKGLKLLKI